MEVLLTDREADVMQVLWEHGPSLVAEVRAHLSDELAYTTVLTIHSIVRYRGGDVGTPLIPGRGSSQWSIELSPAGTLVGAMVP